MATKLVYIGIGVLAVIAAVLVYKIYQQQVNLRQATSPPPSQSSQQTEQNLTPQPVSSDEQELVKSAPPLKTNQEDRVAFRKRLDPFIKDVDLVEITNCIISPLVIRTKDGMELQMKNNDNIEHTLMVGTNEMKISAASLISTKIGQIDLFIPLSCVGGSQAILVQ